MNLLPFEQPSLDDFSFPYFFFSSNKNAELTYVSRSVFHVLGYLPSEIVGRPYSELLKSDDEINRDAESIRKERFAYNSTGQKQMLRAFIHRNGERRVLSLQTVGKVDENGLVIGTQAIAQDVTAQYESSRILLRRLQYLKGLREKLANREVAVLDMMVRGELNKSIARKLSVTERTIENVRARLKAKLCVDTIAEVAAIATELRILPVLVGQFQIPNEDRPGIMDKAPNFAKTVNGGQNETKVPHWNCETN